MDEMILSGYCRCIDGHRMVTAETENGQWCVDCNFGNCPHEANCEIARGIREAVCKELIAIADYPGVSTGDLPEHTDKPQINK